MEVFMAHYSLSIIDKISHKAQPTAPPSPPLHYRVVAATRCNDFIYARQLVADQVGLWGGGNKNNKKNPLRLKLKIDGGIFRMRAVAPRDGFYLHKGLFSCLIQDVCMSC